MARPVITSLTNPGINLRRGLKVDYHYTLTFNEISQAYHSLLAGRDYVDTAKSISDLAMKCGAKSIKSKPLRFCLNASINLFVLRQAKSNIKEALSYITSIYFHMKEHRELIRVTISQVMQVRSTFGSSDFFTNASTWIPAGPPRVPYASYYYTY